MLNHIRILYALLLGNITLSFFNQFTIASAAGLLAFSYILKGLLDQEAKKEPEPNKDLKDKILLLEDKVGKLETKVGAQALRK